MAANSKGVGGKEDGDAVTAVTRDGGGEARLLKRSLCLHRQLSFSQSRIYSHPGWEAVVRGAQRCPQGHLRSLNPFALCLKGDEVALGCPQRRQGILCLLCTVTLV